MSTSATNSQTRPAKFTSIQLRHSRRSRASSCSQPEALQAAVTVSCARRICVALIVAVTVAGCSTYRAPTAAYNAVDAKEREDESSTSAREKLDLDFQEALVLCDSQMTALHDSFAGSGKRELTLASIGIIAGSILVPALAAKAAAAKSTIAAWGGVSGAANAAQYTLQQKGVSASRIGAIYQATRAEISEASALYAKAKKNSDRIVAVTRLSIACRFPQLPAVDVLTPAAPKPETPSSNPSSPGSSGSVSLKGG